jgi:pyrroloquinoline quinone biosynthesis protein D
MNAIPERPRLSRMYRFQWEDAQGNYVLLYPEGMVKLNQSAAEILKRCTGECDVGMIVNDLEKTFLTTGLEDDVKAFLSAATERGWLV